MNPYNYLLAQIHKRIVHYKDILKNSWDIDEKQLYRTKLSDEVKRFNYWRNFCDQNIQVSQKQLPNQPESRIFTLEELKQYDGSNGRPAYVAINGVVYDVSLMRGWGGGTHFGLYAGNDLTDECYQCHGDQIEEVLNKIPKVGLLAEFV